MSGHHFIPVALEGELPSGTVKAVSVEGRSILLCNSDGQVHAVENICSHAHEPLECGLMRRGWISCPAHGARFDLETGEPMNGPATEPIAIFPVRIMDGHIEIAV